MSTERWLPVVGYEGLYEVSDYGRVRSVDRVIIQNNGRRLNLRGKILRPAHTADSRYPHVALSGRTWNIHGLVLEAFVGPCPPGMGCLHDNDIQTDNRLDNLRWGTQSENVQDCIRNGNNYYRNKERCPRSHALVAPNLVPSRLPLRNCLACSRTHSWANGRRHNGEAITAEQFQDYADRWYQTIMDEVTTGTSLGLNPR